MGFFLFPQTPPPSSPCSSFLSSHALGRVLTALRRWRGTCRSRILTSARTQPIWSWPIEPWGSSSTRPPAHSWWRGRAPSRPWQACSRRRRPWAGPGAGPGKGVWSWTGSSAGASRTTASSPAQPRASSPSYARVTTISPASGTSSSSSRSWCPCRTWWAPPSLSYPLFSSLLCVKQEEQDTEYISLRLAHYQMQSWCSLVNNKRFVWLAMPKRLRALFVHDHHFGHLPASRMAGIQSMAPEPSQVSKKNSWELTSQCDLVGVDQERWHVDWPVGLNVISKIILLLYYAYRKWLQNNSDETVEYACKTHASMTATQYLEFLISTASLVITISRGVWLLPKKHKLLVYWEVSSEWRKLSLSITWAWYVHIRTPAV